MGSQMTKIKTQPDLIRALKKAASLELSADDVHRQRVSFVMGTLKEKSDITRAKVEQVLAKQDGRRVA